MTDNLRNKDKISSSDMGFLGLLTILNILNMLDRNLLSAFSNYIVPDLGLSNFQYGLLAGLAFTAFYSVAGLYMGMDSTHQFWCDALVCSDSSIGVCLEFC